MTSVPPEKPLDYNDLLEAIASEIPSRVPPAAILSGKSTPKVLPAPDKPFDKRPLLSDGTADAAGAVW